MKGMAMSMMGEFKTFVMRGNVVDLAVGVIIGGAFGKIVESLVKNLIMPIISVILPTEQTYLGWKLTVNGKDVPYGLFLGDIVNFVVVAAALFFFVVKFLGWIMRAKAKEAITAPAAPPAPTRDQELLMEIRDLLKRQ